MHLDTQPFAFGSGNRFLGSTGNSEVENTVTITNAGSKIGLAGLEFHGISLGLFDIVIIEDIG